MAISDENKNLVVVESPTKAKTLGGFLGDGFEVIASKGHIRDLPKTTLGVDVENDFEPNYVIPKQAKGSVSQLKEKSGEADNVILATDEDREGEAIAWHVSEIIDRDEVDRITFHEITEEAVANALEKPGDINFNLVDAQQARRILDRLVGYKLSPLLWKKLFRGLSAGRVQSAALRLIVERDREIEEFEPDEYWVLTGFFEAENGEIEAQLKEADVELPPDNEDDATDLKEGLESVSEYVIEDVSRETKSYSSPPPFTTSTMQQLASRRLYFSVKKTMVIAQQLYEGIEIDGSSKGLITYMRTDSTNLADSAVKQMRGFLGGEFGDEYVPQKPKSYSSGSDTAQEAHEAIRPTDISLTPDKAEDFLNEDQLKLYRLIWERALASQMTNMQMKVVKFSIVGDETYSFNVRGAQTTFDGFTRVWKKRVKENEVPEVKKGEELELSEIEMEQKFTQPPSHYNEASLVKKLESLGIGRPSTYAPTISKLQDRGYVERSGKHLLAQDTGFLVNDFLVEHFPEIVDYEFTAEMEQDLDEVADGELEWKEIVEEFYNPFIEQIEKKEEEVEKIGAIEELDRECPECEDGHLQVRMGKFGKFIACSNFPDCRYTESLDEEDEDESEEGADGSSSSGSKEADTKTDEETNDHGECPECGGDLVERKSKYGKFLGCSNFPECKYKQDLKQAEVEDLDCPECEEGEVVVRRTKKGQAFYGCSRYPECQFASWDKPVEEKCPTCEGPMVFKEKKGYPVCTQCGYEAKNPS